MPQALPKIGDEVLPLPPVGGEVGQAPTAERTWTDTAKDIGGAAVDLAKGVGAGAASTVYHGGDVLRRGWNAVAPDRLDVERVINRPQVQAAMRPPNSLAGKIGFQGEQVGEFFIPTGVAGKAGKIAEVAKSIALTAAQTGGDPLSTGVSGALTAVMPGGGAITKASSALESGAEKTMTQALGATKEWAKAEAARLAPEMLKRGVGGSREAMLATATATAARVGAELDGAYRVAAANGSTVPSDVINGYLKLASDALKVKDANGVARVIPGTQRVVDKLDELGKFVTSLGTDIPFDRAAVIKRTWDKIVSKAGLFGPKATASATDNADAWAIREAANRFREMLNTNPTIAALNEELSFQTGLKNVLKETIKRTQAQSGGLVAAGTGGAGAIVGALSGDSASDRATKAIIGGFAGRQLVKLMQSPAFRTQVSGPMKQKLAEALAAGNPGQIAGITTRIVSSLPAQLRTSLAP